MGRTPGQGYGADEADQGRDAREGVTSTDGTGSASGTSAGGGGEGSASSFSPSGLAGEIEALRRRLVSGAAVEGLEDGGRLEMLHGLELLTRTVAGAAARLQVGFHTSQVARQIDEGVAPSRAGKAVPDDLAMARMCSPYWGSRDLTAAKALVTEMPHTFAALCEGTISAYQARLVTEGTSCVSAEHRSEIDHRLGPRLPGIGNRELEAAVRALVYEVDPKGFVERARKAAEERGVSVRPLPDLMAVLSARLPAPQAIAAYKSIDTAARLKRASGDPRTLTQLRADELFERLTGRAVVDGIDIEVGLVITDSALLAGTSDPAELIGYGPVPADYAREMLRPHDPDSTTQDDTDDNDGPDNDADDPVSSDSDGPDDEAGRGAGAGDDNTQDELPGEEPEFCPAEGACTDATCTRVHGAPPPPTGTGGDPGPSEAGTAGGGPGTAGGPGAGRVSASRAARAAKVWLRRLYTDPVTGVLTARDPRRRFFTGSLRAFIVARDRTCRTPWCGAAVRAVDHVVRHADGGPTTADNGQGTCERCNLARERPRTLNPPPQTFRPPPPLLPIFPRPTRAP